MIYSLHLLRKRNIFHLRWLLLQWINWSQIPFLGHQVQLRREWMHLFQWRIIYSTPIGKILTLVSFQLWYPHRPAKTLRNFLNCYPTSNQMSLSRVQIFSETNEFAWLAEWYRVVVSECTFVLIPSKEFPLSFPLLPFLVHWIERKSFPSLRKGRL